MSTGDAVKFLDHLKVATNAEHLAIEEVLDFVGPSLTLPLYQRHLMRFEGFYAPLEDALFADGAWPANTLDPEPRRKLTWLQTDLHKLGLEDANSPRCRNTRLPLLHTPGHRFGCLYVLEGSTLGGQVICRHLHNTFGMTPETGSRFFTGYGPRTGSMWNSFRAALNAFATEPGHQQDVVAGALDTYRTLRAWCSEESSA